MRRLYCPAIALALSLCAVTAFADVPDRPTYTRDVQPIVQESCQSCHRASGTNMSGMIAPMSFTNYREVRPWSKAIAKVVSTRAMPPWHASPETHGLFRNERTLTKDEVDTITRWVEQGAKRGNPADAPKPLPIPDTGWAIGEPDMVVSLRKPFWVGDDVLDVQPFIQVTLRPEEHPEPRWVKAIEFKPGSEVVHHIVTFIVEPGAVLDPENQQLFGLIAPGTDYQQFDDGYGILLNPGATIGFAMHYHKEVGPGTGVWDQSLMALKFHDKPVTHPLEISPLTYGVFEIPPKHDRWRVGAAHVFEEDTILLQFMPHTHLRGSAAKYTAFYPDGNSEVLLNVPKYDYNWQTGYDFASYKPIPAGTRLEWEVYFDNSEEQAEAAGFNSERAISFGGPTTEEMDLGWVTYALAEPGRRPNKIPSAPIPQVDPSEVIVIFDSGE